MNYVVGSGPAGVAAAAALLDRGELVTMLDAGGDLESQVRAVVDRLAAQDPEQWRLEDVQGVKGEALRYNSEGMPLKLVFGSDYVYRDVDTLQPVEARGVDAYRALAVGGLSALWGAAILPFSEADFNGWPVSPSQMRPHYASTLQMTGLAGAEDALSRIYPLHASPTALALSRQAEFMFARASQHREQLEAQHVYVGRARLAVAQPNARGQSCTYCGMCLYGCPYGLIYTTAFTLRERLLTSQGFTYVPGMLVRRLSERDGAVAIDAVVRDTRRPTTFRGERVYLAAGALGSTAILLESLQERSHPVLLRQSDHFLLPMRLKGFSGSVAQERLHTLCQLFIEILSDSSSRRNVHLQLYTYSDFYPRMARDRLGPLYPLVAPLVDRFSARFVMIKGYLHSDDSAAIQATLTGRSGGAALRLDAVDPGRSRQVLRSITSLLRKNSDHLGASPVTLALRLGLPGSGAHVGGSFPMRDTPGGFESDSMGRPVGFSRVHVVDSTVFPTIPAAPPTLTIMANAWRIASEAA